MSLPVPCFLSFFQFISSLLPSSMRTPNPSRLSNWKLPSKTQLRLLSRPQPFLRSSFQAPSYLQPMALFSRTPQPLRPSLFHSPTYWKPFLQTRLPTSSRKPSLQNPMYLVPSSRTRFYRVRGTRLSLWRSRYCTVWYIELPPPSDDSSAIGSYLSWSCWPSICEMIHYSFLRKAILLNAMSLPRSLVSKYLRKLSRFLSISSLLSSPFMPLANTSWRISLQNTRLTISLMSLSWKQLCRVSLHLSMNFCLWVSFRQKESTDLSSWSRILSMLAIILAAMSLKVALMSCTRLLTQASWRAMNSKIFLNLASKGQYLSFSTSPRLTSSTASRLWLCTSCSLKKQASQTKRVGS